ncbi:relaxase/mobilization nuclease domain-containing protein [Pedobacter sp. UBA5917]|jgi:hypothetical protein|uniref:relaxase/mobilization nuclease domain-containing protein n=1 Tax=Pedobacter sp. UBA5917 TaxID=1947061 RepID=UPI0025F5FA17|nr:relaxase/mobilization nuclease domain-containing protein [Pedobacter sp. UBA5917]
MKINRFTRLTRLNAKVKTNTLHISLNFHKNDKLDAEKLVEIVRAYMEGLGFRDQPYLAYRHFDAHHPHIHLVTTNIQRNGERIDIHGIGYKRSEPVRKQIEQQFGLTVAEGRKETGLRPDKILEPKTLEYGEKETRKSLSRLVQAVRSRYLYGNLSEFNTILKQFNAIALPGPEGSKMQLHKGLLFAVLDESGKQIGVPIKASLLSGKPILKNLEQDFSSKQSLKAAHKAELKERVNSLLSAGTPTMKDFQASLSVLNIDLVQSHATDRRIFGLTYIDHDNRVIFKGSELGKNYSAAGIAARLKPALDPGQNRGEENRGTIIVDQQLNGESKGLDIGFLYEQAPIQGISPLVKKKKKKKRFMGRGQQR